MKKIILVLTVLLAGLQYSAAQKVTVTGVVTSREDGLPIIGASVIEKGTSNGAITDLDGNFSISVSVGATLDFTYLGMVPQSRRITEATQLNIVLSPDAFVIDEVVVTAMGVTTEKRRLNFAVQSVGAEELTNKRATNFVNALQGKIAGLSVTNSSGSPNSGAQVIIRGISSINPSQNNEPLFVMDGVPIAGRGSEAADINPNDIENVTVLKGAAAAALYGQEAASGVIMITTKKGQIGKVIATASTSWQLNVPMRVTKLQTSYGPGNQGFYRERTGEGWGPLLSKDQQTYDNVNNFLQNGVFQKYDLSLSGGSEKFQGYASATYSKDDGTVPNDYLNRLGILLKGTYQPVEALKFTVSTNTTDNTSRSFAERGAATGTETGMQPIYNWPITDDITDYELITGFPRFRYYSDVKYNSPISPLFARYNDHAQTKRLRNIINGQVDWKPAKNLNLIGRVSYDVTNTTFDNYRVPRWDKSVVYPDMTAPSPPGEDATTADWAQYENEMAAFDEFLYKYRNTPYLSAGDIRDMNKDALGYYEVRSSRSQLFTATAIATYKWELPKEFNIDFLAGAEMKMSEGFNMMNRGRDFMIPGTYSLANTNPDYVFLNDRTNEHSQRRLYGYFGEIRGDYKGLASLSVTSRWDWSSTLLTNPYYYPSVTGGLLFSELFNLSNDVFSYGKLRGNYAVVGKDAYPYLFDRRFKQFATYPDNGYGIDPTKSSASRDLQPELTYSWEVGADLRFFNSRTRLDMAYYSTKVDNQIVTVRVSPASGYILQVRNEGAIRNEGVEFTLEQDIIKTGNFSWTTALNFGLNRSKMVSLPDDMSENSAAQYGDIFTSVVKGKPTTSVTGKDYLRTEDGKIICGEDGIPQIGTDKNTYIGNREPKFLAGITNTLNYKNWSLSFLFDGRLGGDVVNITGRGLISNGQSPMLETYRGRQVVVEGVVLQEDGSYLPNTTPITLDHYNIMNYFHGVSSNFVEDGSYIRLSYVTLGYELPVKLARKAGFAGLRCSFTGNNLLLLTRYTGNDPVANANTALGGTGAMGIDSYAIPSVTGYNFSITSTF